MRKGKVFIKSFVICFILTTCALAAFTTAKYHTTTPEFGITCMKVDALLGGQQEIGCYRGDVTKPDNCMDKVATLKYQPDATIINLGGFCKG